MKKLLVGLTLISSSFSLFAQEITEESITLGNRYSAGYGSFYALDGTVYFSAEAKENKADVDVVYWNGYDGFTASGEVFDDWDVTNTTTFQVIDAASVDYSSITATEIYDLIEDITPVASTGTLEVGSIVLVNSAEDSENATIKGIARVTEITNMTLSFDIKKINTDDFDKTGDDTTGDDTTGDDTTGDDTTGDDTTGDDTTGDDTATLIQESTANVIGMQGRVTIDITGAATLNCTVYTMSGNVVFNETFSGSESVDLPAGLYIVALTDSKGTILESEKVMVH